jgi:N utilization substance protein B
MLYQWDLNREDIETVRSAFWEVHPGTPEVREFADRLVAATVAGQERIDRLITKHARHWRLERMETLDRNLLRMATSELLSGLAPAGVVINEAIEIARRFSSAGSPDFVNGLLDSIRKDVEAQEGPEPAAGAQASSD